VPYAYEVADTTADGKPVTRRLASRATFLADRLETRATLEIETRSRGIYAVPVYRWSSWQRASFRAGFSVDRRDAIVG
jgi:inner membrane protein involved in colicin E2 resistance